jgi:hypothetical protein
MKRLLLVLLAVGCMAASCGPADSTCASAKPVKLSDVQQAIFTPTCATTGCHEGASPAQNLSLEDGKTFGNVVNKQSTLAPGKQLVKPDDAADSELYVQVHSQLMPQTGGPLTSDQIASIHDWICSGALNN